MHYIRLLKYHSILIISPETLDRPMLISGSPISWKTALKHPLSFSPKKWKISPKNIFLCAYIINGIQRRCFQNCIVIELKTQKQKTTNPSTNPENIGSWKIPVNPINVYILREMFSPKIFFNIFFVEQNENIQWIYFVIRGLFHSSSLKIPSFTPPSTDS